METTNFGLVIFIINFVPKLKWTIIFIYDKYKVRDEDKINKEVNK